MNRLKNMIKNKNKKITLIVLISKPIYVAHNLLVFS